jgi:D-glycero-alpha-D-manno-heptose-7-phosphate kinase
LTKNLLVDEDKFLAQKQLVDLVPPFKDNLIKSNWQSLGEILHTGWLLKKKTSGAISNNLIDELYNLGLKNGAWGGKLLGAGGGGFLLFMASPSKQAKLRKAFSKLQELKVGFDLEGSRAIYDRRTANF